MRHLAFWCLTLLGLAPFLGAVELEFWQILRLVAVVIGLAWLLYLREPHLPDKIRDRIKPLYNLLVRKYGFDEFNQKVFAGGARYLGGFLWRVGDERIIDGLAVNGTARAIGWLSSVVRHVQSGYIYHYAFAMIIGLFLLMTFFLHR